MTKQDGGGNEGSERREWLRIFVDLEVDYGNSDNFLFAYISDISETGIFIRTTSPQKPGTRLNLRFTPNDGNRQLLELEGEVIWVNVLRPENRDNIDPGMGVKFLALEGDVRHRLVEYIKTFALLDDPEESEDEDGAKSDTRSN